MTQHPRRLPRETVAILLEAAKAREGLQWWEIELALDLTKGSREAWMNGKVTKPPLQGMCRLAQHLNVTGDELMAAVCDDELPEWVPAPFAKRELARRRST